MAAQTAALGRAIEQHFAAAYDDTPTAYGDAPFTPPTNAAWVRLTVLAAGARRELLTGDRTTGKSSLAVVTVQVFTPRDSGPGAPRAIVDAVRDALEEAVITTSSGARVMIGTASPGRSSDDPKEPWSQTTIAFEAAVLER